MRAKAYKKQSGMVLIAMMMVIFVVGTTLFFSATSNRSGDIAEKIEVSEQLAIAKQALIAYAINYSDYYDVGPGRLPCPDIVDTGEPYSFISGSTTYTYCHNRYFRYKLPQFTDLPSGSRYKFNDYYANSDRQFWYAVSYDYRADTWTNPDYRILNSSKTGDFTLDGEDDIVAVIIAPGAPIIGEETYRAGTTYNQSRPSSYWTNSNNYRNYLEQDHATNYSTTFINSYANDPGAFNDRVIGISHSEIMTGVTAKVMGEIQNQLGLFHPTNGDAYPANQADFENIMDDPAAADWFEDDDWDNVTTYTRDSANVATLEFDRCDIVYRLDFVNGLSRSENKC